MDIRFLTTFIEVSQTRHFGKAADNLYLTQSAVSARIKLLEEYFGTPLFVRHRHSIQLTRAGEKLIPYAQTLVSGLSEARSALASEDMQYIACAATPNANELVLSKSLGKAQSQFPDFSFRAEILAVEQLSRQLHERIIHVGFAMEPLKSDDFENILLASMPLTLYSTKGSSVEQALQDYVHIEWNNKISEQFFHLYPLGKKAKLTTSSYSVAINHLQKNGGSALLPTLNSHHEIGFVGLNPIAIFDSMTVKAHLVYMKDFKQNELHHIVEYFKQINMP